MKRIIVLLLYFCISSFLCLFCFSSCWIDWPIGGMDKSAYYEDYCSSYVATYVDADGVVVNDSSLLDVDYVISLTGSMIKYISEGEERAVFDSLARSNNDFGYTGSVEFDKKTNISARIALVNGIAEFHVIAETDYDEAHPVGGYLDDCVLLSFVSFSAYVNSGYVGSFPEKQTKRLSDIDWNHAVFLSRDFNLKFKGKNPGKESFYVTITDQTGKTFTSSSQILKE